MKENGFSFIKQVEEEPFFSLDGNDRKKTQKRHKGRKSDTSKSNQL